MAKKDSEYASILSSGRPEQAVRHKAARKKARKMNLLPAFFSVGLKVIFDLIPSPCTSDIFSPLIISKIEHFLY